MINLNWLELCIIRLLFGNNILNSELRIQKRATTTKATKKMQTMTGEQNSDAGEKESF